MNSGQEFRLHLLDEILGLGKKHDAVRNCPRNLNRLETQLSPSTDGSRNFCGGGLGQYEPTQLVHNVSLPVCIDIPST